MRKKIEKIMDSKILLSFLIILLISLSVGAGTYAWFTWSSTDNPSVTLSIGKLADVIFDRGPDVNIDNLSPVFYYDEGIPTTFSIKNNDSTHSYLLYNVKINVTEIDSTLSSESFKYALTSGSMLLAQGSFNGVSNGETIDIITTSMPEGTSNYTLYFYLDSNIENNTSIMTKSFKGTIEVSSPELTGNIKTIADLFTPNSTVTNNSINYHVDTTHNLIKDTLGNIRYYGSNPNNYIKFNCDTYPDTNCELWRIIGIVDGKVKLMRNQQIGKFSWDTSASTVNSGYGINEWSQADLMKLLNPGYETNQDLNASSETITVNNSLYYNSGSGTCYNERSNVSTTTGCNFTSSGVQGIKNDATRNKIAEATFYTGGWNSYSVYSNVILDKERGTTTVSNPSDGITRTTTWIGRVSVPYPSDYGYAADLSLCTLKTLNQYYDSNCKVNNWMKNIITNNGSNVGWLLTPGSGYAYYAWYVHSNGDVGSYNRTSYAHGVVPVLYLSSEAIIESGSGTEGNPYTLAA